MQLCSFPSTSHSCLCAFAFICLVKLECLSVLSLAKAYSSVWVCFKVPHSIHSFNPLSYTAELPLIFLHLLHFIFYFYQHLYDIQCSLLQLHAEHKEPLTLRAVHFNFGHRHFTCLTQVLAPLFLNKSSLRKTSMSHRSPNVNVLPYVQILRLSCFLLIFQFIS